MKKVGQLRAYEQHHLLDLCDEEVSLSTKEGDWRQFTTSLSFEDSVLKLCPTLSQWNVQRKNYTKREMLVHKLSKAPTHSDDMDKSCILICALDGGNSLLDVGGNIVRLDQGGIYMFNDFIPHNFSSNYESVLVTWGSVPKR